MGKLYSSPAGAKYTVLTSAGRCEATGSQSRRLSSFLLLRMALICDAVAISMYCGTVSLGVTTNAK
ncbi:unknown [Bacteroides sp. CAG:927]|nr:unknown [Bacteroides sp. CAG:927]